MHESCTLADIICLNSSNYLNEIDFTSMIAYVKKCEGFLFLERRLVLLRPFFVTVSTDISVFENVTTRRNVHESCKQANAV